MNAAERKDKLAWMNENMYSLIEAIDYAEWMLIHVKDERIDPSLRISTRLKVIKHHLHEYRMKQEVEICLFRKQEERPPAKVYQIRLVIKEKTKKSAPGCD
jgi:hypothetical protein